MLVVSPLYKCLYLTILRCPLGFLGYDIYLKRGTNYVKRLLVLFCISSLSYTFHLEAFDYRVIYVWNVFRKLKSGKLSVANSFNLVANLTNKIFAQLNVNTRIVTFCDLNSIHAWLHVRGSARIFASLILIFLWQNYFPVIFSLNFLVLCLFETVKVTQALVRELYIVHLKTVKLCETITF